MLGFGLGYGASNGDLVWGLVGWLVGLDGWHFLTSKVVGLVGLGPGWV